MSTNTTVGKYATGVFNINIGEYLDVYCDDYFDVSYIVYNGNTIITKNIGLVIGQLSIGKEDISFVRRVQITASGSDVSLSIGNNPFVPGIRDTFGVTANKRTITISGNYNLTVEDVINSDLSFNVPAGVSTALVFPSADVLMNSGFFSVVGKFYNFKIRNLTPGNDVNDGIFIAVSITPINNHVLQFFGLPRLYPVGLGFPTVAEFMMGRVEDLPSGDTNIIIVRKT